MRITDKESLFNRIKENLSQNQLLIVCVAGASCSGKSTISKEIKSEFQKYNPIIVCQDNWFKNIEDIPRDEQGYVNMESEGAFYVSEFLDDLDCLMKNHYIMIPSYEIETNHRITKNKQVFNGNLVIIEGLHTIKLTENLNYNKINVFMNTSINTCANRRAERDIKFIDRSIDFFERYYKQFIYPNYKNYVDEQISILNPYDILMEE